MAAPMLDGIQIAYAANVIRICQLAPTVVTLYDHLITLDQEVELVWNKRWSIAKIMFLWNRYFGSFFLLAESIASVRSVVRTLLIPHGLIEYHVILFSCRSWFFVQGWSTAIIIWSMQSIMLFRTFAMYRRCRPVVIFCLISYAAEIISMAAILVVSFCYIDAINEPFPGVYICTPHNVPHYIYAFWLPVIAFDCILFGFALWTCIGHVNNLLGWTFSMSPMWEVLLTDSLFYFSVTLTAYIANAVVWLILPAHWLKLPQGFSIAGTCVMGVRLVLNLRKAYYIPSPGDFELDTMDPNVPSQRRRLSQSPMTPSIPSAEHSIQLQDVIFVTGDILRRLSETLVYPHTNVSESLRNNGRRVFHIDTGLGRSTSA